MIWRKKIAKTLIHVFSDLLFSDEKIRQIVKFVYFYVANTSISREKYQFQNFYVGKIQSWKIDGFVYLFLDEITILSSNIQMFQILIRTFNIYVNICVIVSITNCFRITTEKLHSNDSYLICQLIKTDLSCEIDRFVYVLQSRQNSKVVPDFYGNLTGSLYKM